MGRPEGRITRGKTAPNRLRRLDRFLCEHDSALLSSPGPEPVVDLGFGRLPLTTLEMATRFRALNSSLPFVGVEIEPDRVEAAQEHATTSMSFRLGGFNLPLRGQKARLIRAMNVLRQYPEEEAQPAHALLVSQLSEGGLLVEGTSSPFGRRIVVNLIRRGVDGGVCLEGILFSLNFREGTSPDLFPSVLPKQLIHRHVPGEWVFEFFERWRSASDRARYALTFGSRQHFVQAARLLAEEYPGVGVRQRWLRQGFLYLRAPPYP